MRRLIIFAYLLILLVVLTGCNHSDNPGEISLDIPDEGTAHLTYFYAEDCASCDVVMDEILTPIFDQCGAHIALKMVNIAESEGYAVFLDTEAHFIGEAGRWEIPTLVTEDTYFIGERAIREQLQSELQCIFSAGGNTWPEVKSLFAYDGSEQPTATTLDFAGGGDQDVEACVEDEVEICVSPSPIFVLYMTDSECTDVCDRTLYDLRYLQGLFPAMEIEERDLGENLDLAKALIETYGDGSGFAPEAPLVFVGEDILFGDALTVDSLEALLRSYADTGAPANWYLISAD